MLFLFQFKTKKTPAFVEVFNKLFIADGNNS
jgi:hypothetical protein